MVNPKSLANLKQFKDGHPPAHIKQKGEVSLTAAIRRYAREHPEEMDELAAAMFRQARRNPAFANLIAERIDGKVTQPVGNPDGTPLPTPTFIFQMPDGSKKTAHELASASK